MSEVSDAVTAAAKELTIEEEELLKVQAAMQSQKLVDKIKYLNVHMDTMDPKDKLKYSGQFDKLGKSLSKLRRMIRKKMSDESWHLTVWLCVTILVLLYAFFGYKLYKSLVERDRKREEKLKAKQSKKKK